MSVNINADELEMLKKKALREDERKAYYREYYKDYYYKNKEARLSSIRKYHANNKDKISRRRKELRILRKNQLETKSSEL